jgi:hypothetical protein
VQVQSDGTIEVSSTQGSAIGLVSFTNQLVSFIVKAGVNVDSLSSGKLTSFMIEKFVANCPQGSPGPQALSGLLSDGSAVKRQNGISVLNLNCGARSSFYQLSASITPSGGTTIIERFGTIPFSQ